MHLRTQVTHFGESALLIEKFQNALGCLLYQLQTDSVVCECDVGVLNSFFGILQ